MMWGGGGIGLVWLVFLGFIVAGIILVIRGSFEREGRRDPEKSALDVLDERFARGEIDRDEYEGRKRILLDSRRR